MHARLTPRAGAMRRDAPATFLVLVVGLSTPMWLLGSRVDGELQIGALTLPVSAGMFAAPLVAVALLAPRSLPRSLRRAMAVTSIRPRRRLVTLACLMPALLGGVAAVEALAGRTSGQVDLVALPVLVVAFWMAAAAEEVGWTAHATPALRRRLGRFATALTLGVVWAGVHVIPYAQAGHDASWIAWQCLFTVAARWLILTAFEETSRNLAAAVLVHASINVAIAVVPPGGYAPALAAPLTCAAAAWAAWRLRRPNGHRPRPFPERSCDATSG